MGETKRESGFYWVKYNGEWEVAFYSNGHGWLVTGTLAPMSGSRFGSIGPRIRPPKAKARSKQAVKS